MLVAVLLTLAAAAAAGAAGDCYCVPAGHCGGLISRWERKQPRHCEASGGQCCDLDRLPETAELIRPGRQRPALAHAEPELSHIEFDGFQLPTVELHEPEPFPRPQPDPQFDIELPEAFEF